jgi:hypothetical protein
VNVRGVAGEQHASAPVGVGESTLDAERRRPFDRSDGAADLRRQTLTEVRDDVVGRWIGGGSRRRRRHQSPQVGPGQGKGDE